MDKTYGESKMCTQQKQGIETPEDPRGQTTPLKYWNKGKPPVEHRMT